LSLAAATVKRKNPSGKDHVIPDLKTERPKRWVVWRIEIESPRLAEKKQVEHAARYHLQNTLDHRASVINLGCPAHWRNEQSKENGWDGNGQHPGQSIARIQAYGGIWVRGGVGNYIAGNDKEHDDGGMPWPRQRKLWKDQFSSVMQDHAERGEESDGIKIKGKDGRYLYSNWFHRRFGT
jgi:hypothetical protein